jgi:hypothetical protein
VGKGAIGGPRVLARLFDATQEELLHQNEELSTDGRRAEAQFVSLSAFERIAHKHLIDVRRKDVRARNLGRSAWLELLRGFTGMLSACADSQEANLRPRGLTAASAKAA